MKRKEGDGIIGAILISGVYDPVCRPSKAYYGEDASKYPSMSAIRHVEGRRIPVFMIFAELDPYFFDEEAANLILGVDISFPPVFFFCLDPG